MPDGEKGTIRFPPGFQLIQLEGMEGLNTKAQRPAIKDQEFSWALNFIPIGAANARTLYDRAAYLFTRSGGLTIINHAYYNIGATAYGIAFMSDGSAVQVQLSNGAQTTVGAAGTFFNGSGPAPTISQWADKGILIVSISGATPANSYWAWDGTLWPPGNGTSPAWLNGGTPTAMPTGVAGTAIEIFLSRVWIVNGTTRLTSVASNGADFATGDGGISAPNTDSSLRVKYTGIKAANGYLYLFGDSSCAYITNVTQTGSTASYQYTVIDPQIGTPWRDSIVPFGRSILFANSNGVYALYGSSANKISDPLDGIWNDSVANFATVIPSAGVSTLFGIKVFCITVYTTDPTTSTQSAMLAMFDGKKWFMASQNPAPLLIAPQETNSDLESYGSDGLHLYKMFAVRSATLPKKIVSKLWGGKYGFVSRKQVLRFYTEVQAVGNTSVDLMMTLDTESGSSASAVSFSQAITFINALGGVLQFQNNSLGDLFFQSEATISANNLNGSGLLIGFTVSTTSPDFVFLRGGIGYADKTPLY